jgi:hypothetical protein
MRSKILLILAIIKPLNLTEKHVFRLHFRNFLPSPTKNPPKRLLLSPTDPSKRKPSPRPNALFYLFSPRPQRLPTSTPLGRVNSQTFLQNPNFKL